MALTYPTLLTTDMELTPCQVLWTPPGGSETDLGGTLGNVVITQKYMKAGIKADQSGETIRDRRVSGAEFTVTTELTQVLDKNKWKVVFPHATLAGSYPANYITFNQAIGDSDLSKAGVLRLHPMSKDPADNDTDHFFWLACASAESSIIMGPTEQMRLKIVWNILPDESVSPERFYRFGDGTL